tara:strand:+ start:4479 stop:4805 length:327 start_codon:yes stop_codon:yes gene_type:complete
MLNQSEQWAEGYNQGKSDQLLKEGQNFDHIIAQAKKEAVIEAGELIQLRKLPYSYKIKSPFPGEGVEFHLKRYGHLPFEGCCEYDQMSDEETDIYNKAIDDVTKVLTS